MTTRPLSNDPAPDLDKQSARLLLLAYACDPAKSMESRLGWHRALHAAKQHEVWVLHGGQTPSEELQRIAAAEQPDARLHFVAVDNSRLGSAGNDLFDLFWLRYRLWHRQAYRVARSLHEKWDFSLFHQVNFCGYREPGISWQLGIPFIWGPVGGTQNLPLRFLTQCDLRGGLREVVRNLGNAMQLRYCPRVRAAGRAASTALAATRVAQTDLARWHRIPTVRLLEIGVEEPDDTDRTPRDPDKPFRLLWAGRHQTWKALPLLLQALAKLPSDCDYELRVLGVGPSNRRWRQQAERLGLLPRITWAGWPDSYEQTLPHYRWADAFVFTSLRDTSGTGLLESLQMGTPIIGLDHQGASDIMTPDCALPIPVETPQQVIGDLSQAIERLSGDPQAWLAMSKAAKNRAQLFRWDRLGDRMEEVYQQVLAAAVEQQDDRVAAGDRCPPPDSFSMATTHATAGSFR